MSTSTRPSKRDLAEVDAVVPPTAATFTRAQRYVASQSLNIEDARELLGALGLLPCDFWRAVAAL